MRQPRVQAWVTVSLLYQDGNGYPSSEHASKNRRMRNQNSWMPWQELWLTVGPRVPRADGRLLLVLPALFLTLADGVSTEIPFLAQLSYPALWAWVAPHMLGFFDWGLPVSLQL